MKTSKTQITSVLRSENTTEIFKIAKASGIDVSNRGSLMRWIEAHSPSQKVSRKAYNLSYGAGDFKHHRINHSHNRNKVIAAIKRAKFEKAKGYMETNYGKILVIGNENIYWAHPVYQHQDYNKSIAFTNTEKNRRLAAVINSYLMK
ncbi:hypothetical protein [Marinoscillum furvescens]|uniref:Uncharacterized protein n=1 Tax=Marinoscillum furvescens DSM 4134 TaxID=1122208 RepID=A0A3D9L895_MARFU|nr:hypothetical protein [Marinoscillum furvescens]REE01097.1 hypothetical protein C7460_104117 [Marinoscillum furvescens DSM 4134]